MATVPPPPTYADVVLTDERTKKSVFNPIWLNWFLEIAQTLSQSGGGGGGGIQHNSLAGLQGGAAAERYHTTAAQNAIINSLPSTFVSGFNTRTGGVTLESVDVTSALGFTPEPAFTGMNVTITTAKLTSGGANGSMTFTNGVLTAQTPAT